ncbi:hypothetical protein TNCV_706541 [Trichonephila clavipes]|nr:hypothetical protein TNCV_706541 [Trichonephila clavipes]
MTLMEPLLNKGHCLTTDNFYSSPELADILIQSLTDMYGTLKPRRKDSSIIMGVLRGGGGGDKVLPVVEIRQWG